VGGAAHYSQGQKITSLRWQNQQPQWPEAKISFGKGSFTTLPRQTWHTELGGRYSKWVVILFKFDLIFSTPKAKKSLVFAELMAGLPRVSQPLQELEPLLDDFLFLMDTLDPWYGDILVYLQTQSFWSSSTKDDRQRLRHLAQHYLIIGDALYHFGVDTMLRRCVTHEEAKLIMNDCHLGACGGHLSGFATAQKILRAGYFWPSIFKDCITVIKKCHPCQIFS
jgi:hypothetical protein